MMITKYENPNNIDLPPSTPKERRSADIRFASFTLIELLVVVVIIAILSSMLLPGMNKARGSAKSISCVGNLKQIASADALYQNDYLYYVPSSFNMTGSVGEPAWCGARAASTGLYDFTQPGLLSPYLKRASKEAGLGAESAKNVLFCPAPEVSAFLSATKNPAFSGEISVERAPAGGYGANMLIHGWTNNPQMGITYPSMGAVMRKSGSIRNASRIISFGDSAGGSMGVSFSSYTLYLGIDNATVCYRHNGSIANFAWADGHVSGTRPAYIRSDGAAKAARVGGPALPGWSGVLACGNNFYFHPDSEYADEHGVLK